MIKLEKTEVLGWEHAIRGMRNPMNSWDKSDSAWCKDRHTCDNCCFEGNIYGDKVTYPVGCDEALGKAPKFSVGKNDHGLMTKLAKGGPVHAKYRRMITVYVDITAPLYWWKEFDTYKVGTVANSCSTMHKIHAKELTRDDFSCEHMNEFTLAVLDTVIRSLNTNRNFHLEAKAGNTQFDAVDAKDYWWQMIQLLPTSYNQKRTVMLNYEVLAGLYPMRKNHKLDEWHVFCDWIEKLPYSELITGGADND